MSAELSFEEIIDLPGMEDVKAELEDPRFGNRLHGNFSAITVGCRGPLCKKANRDHQRNISMKKAVLAGRKFKEDQFRLWDRDELFDEIIVWHRLKVAVMRNERRNAI